MSNVSEMSEAACEALFLDMCEFVENYMADKDVSSAEDLDCVAVMARAIEAANAGKFPAVHDLLKGVNLVEALARMVFDIAFPDEPPEAHPALFQLHDVVMDALCCLEELEKEPDRAA